MHVNVHITVKHISGIRHCNGWHFKNLMFFIASRSWYRPQVCLAPILEQRIDERSLNSVFQITVKITLFAVFSEKLPLFKALLIFTTLNKDYFSHYNLKNCSFLQNVWFRPLKIRGLNHSVTEAACMWVEVSSATADVNILTRQYTIGSRKATE